jgi:pimeloyl-ACP methyl ester carboxylesterase
MANHMKKNKKPSLLFALKAIQFLYPKVEFISSYLAAKWFIHLFFSPIKYKPTHKEIEALSRGKSYFIEVENKKIHVCSWGEGRAVLAVHGWAGRGTQFRKMVEPLNKAGFKLVAIDGPAHGKSDGSKTEIREFSRVISAVYQQENACAIIAHSFGGVASLYAISEGLQNKIQINIASPTIGEEIIQTFLKALKASQDIGKRFRNYIIQKTGQPFEYFSALSIIKRIPIELNLLLVHDLADPEVSIEHPKALRSVYPPAELLQTNGLGHNRILKDDEVIQQIVTFIRQKTSIEK